MASLYACSFRQVVEGIFGRVVGLESASSSIYTALGYELYRVSQEAYECDGPGRIAIFEYDGCLATASTVKTPLLHIFDRLETRYATLISNNPAELSKRIKSFLEACSPDMIALAGSNIYSTIFQKALSLSNAIGRVNSNGSIEVEDILVKGAAQAVEDVLENHDIDCSEFPECLAIRREADRIAGEYKFSRPKMWPAVNNRHWRKSSDLSSDLGHMPIDNADHYLYVQG